MSTRRIRVAVPQTTAAILYALAQANKTTVEKLFTHFAEAMADDAGRREGSWEAESVNRFRAAFAPQYPVNPDVMVFVQTGGWFRGFMRGQRFAWPLVRRRGTYSVCKWDENEAVREARDSVYSDGGDHAKH